MRGYPPQRAQVTDWRGGATMRRAWVAASAVAIALGAASGSLGAATPAVSPGLGGCRLLIGAQNPTLDESTKISLGGNALTSLRKVKDHKLEAIFKGSLSITKLLKWCHANYPAKKLSGASSRPATTAAAYTPVPTDFQITPTILSKSCFGSAGCNITFRIAVNYVGAHTPDPSKSYTITYDVTGGEQPMTNNFTLKGDQITYRPQEIIQTASDADTLTITATQVLPN